MYYKQTQQGYMVRLRRGEEIHAALTRFMKAKDIAGGAVIGLGAVTDVALGFFDIEKQEYTRQEYHDDYELINLTGNLSYLDGEPLLHAHVVISGEDMAALAGHLFAATISVTGEFEIRVAGERIERAFDNETGLKLLDLPEKLDIG